MADLKLSAYILSKFIVQGIFAFIQACLLTVVFQKVAGASSNSILIDPFWDIQLICFLSILSASAMGLFISCIVKNTSMAMIIIPLALLPQLLFSGVLYTFTGFAEFLSNLILCRWSIEGLGTSVNLNSLTYIVQTINPFMQVEPDKHFLFTTSHMYQVIAVFIAMTFAFLLGSYIVLKKNINKNM